MDNEKLYEDMKPKEKFEVLWAESGLAIVRERKTFGSRWWI